MAHLRKEEALTQPQLRKIFELKRLGYTQTLIAERFGVSKTWIEHILARGPGYCGSRGEGLGPRSSLADDGRDPANPKEKV